MRLIASLLALGCIVSLAPGQWVYTTIQLSGLDSICSVQSHSPNHTVYVGGNGKLVAVDAVTHKKVALIDSPGPLNLMCSITAGNKMYCAALDRESVWVMDCATNRFLTTVPLDGQAHAMCYAAGPNKVYVACPPDSLVDVIDCATDSVVTCISVPSWPSALCYNPELNRIYVAQSTSDKVAVIDCAADTVISTIWVRGAEPTAVCYDSTTNCVYTANHASGTSSVIDCAGDSLVRIVAVDAKPDKVLAGPEGKVYCGGYSDSVLAVVEPHGARTIPVGRHLSNMSFDPVNKKVYCAMTDSEVIVVDAIEDTVAARVRAGEDLRFVCYDPADTSTWAASTAGATVSVIDGPTYQVTDKLWLGVFDPATLCYSPASSRLYCLNDSADMLLVVDGDSNRVLKVLPVRGSSDSMLWNPHNNRVYFTSATDNTVSVLDCANDSITATVQTGDSPSAMCCSEDGKVYVTTKGGVTVIDPDRDSIRAVASTPYDPTSLCYDRTDNKVYAVLGGRGRVCVIDADGDSIVATVPVALSSRQVVWHQNHDRVYVCAPDDQSVAVIDCTNDTVLQSIGMRYGPWMAYSDTACDNVCVNAGIYLYIMAAATDTFRWVPYLVVYKAGGIIDNGRPGENNRLYCTCYTSPFDGLYVISGADDSTWRYVRVGTAPTALAWNPVHLWVYVVNSGSSSISVVSDTMLGVEESQPQAPSPKLQATVVRGVLMTEDRGPKTGDRAQLLDVSGRRVLELHPGANDVSHLAPGVYFVISPSPSPSPPEGERVGVRRRPASSIMRDASSVTKVVIAR